MNYFHTCILNVSESSDSDAKYVKVLLKLEADINSALTVSKKENIFDTFVERYTVVPEIWNLIIRHHHTFEFINISKYLKQPISDLYFNISIFDSKYSSNEYYPWKNKILFSQCYLHARNYVTDFEYFLTFPNCQLENQYKNCDEFSYRPIPKKVLQKYKNAKTFADRILDKNLSYEKWIEILFEWDNPEFAYQTIEYKLTEEIWNKNLWKAYINATENRNPKIVLNIIGRYIQLFLSDAEMKQKYERTIEKIYKNDEFENLEELLFYLYDEIPKKPQTFKFLNAFENSQIQNFSLPETFIYYILDCSKAFMRMNLFKTCKSLFLLKSTPICHHLRVSSNFKAAKYLLQSVEIQGIKEIDFKVFSKMYISNRLEIRYSNIEMLQRIIIPKLYKCDARFIFICQQVITYKEFQFLVDPFRIEKFSFDNGGITNDDGSVVDLKLILERLSNAYNIGIDFNQKYDLSPLKLSGLKRDCKIELLFLKHFNGLLNLKDYCIFILENATPNAKFLLGYNNDVKLENAEMFNKSVNEFIRSNLNEKIIIYFEIGYFERFKAENLSKIVYPKIVEL